MGLPAETERLIHGLRARAGTDFRDAAAQSALSDFTDHLTSLPAIYNADIVQLLRESYEQLPADNSQALVCRACCEAIARRSDKSAVPLLGRLLLDPATASLHEDLAEILGELEDPRAVPFLRNALRDPEAWVRAKAAKSLGQLGATDVTAALVDQLSDPSSEVRERVVQALGRLRDPQAVPALIATLGNDPEPTVRATTATVLGSMRASGAVPLLQSLVAEASDEDDENHEELVEAAQAALAELTATPTTALDQSPRQIRAAFDDGGIWVYQAFRPEIADEALQRGRFGQRFNRARMTWIKPSFAWMLYRSHYASKPRQERILKIRLTHEGFRSIVAEAVPTTFSPSLFATEADWRTALRRADVRYQWDPDRDLTLRPLARRALQLGIKDDIVRRYVDEWIIELSDVTDLAHEIRSAVERGAAQFPHVPEERPYPVATHLQRRLGMDQG